MPEQPPVLLPVAGIDLNADLGEECGDDAAILSVVTTANIAAGAHAGGGNVLVETVTLAARRGVQVGAHISYPDRENFGRVSMLADLSADDLAASLASQLLAVHHAATKAGVPVTHVKPHGALYNDAADNPFLARLILTVIASTTDSLGLPAPWPIMGLPNTAMHWQARREHIRFVPEGFADRAYRLDGTLQPRSEPGAVLTDTVAVLTQAVQIATAHEVTTVPDGVVIPMPVETLCLHGDTPDAVEHAETIRELFTATGIPIRRFVFPASSPSTRPNS